MDRKKHKINPLQRKVTLYKKVQVSYRKNKVINAIRDQCNNVEHTWNELLENVAYDDDGFPLFIVRKKFHCCYC